MNILKLISDYDNNTNNIEKLENNKIDLEKLTSLRFYSFEMIFSIIVALFFAFSPSINLAIILNFVLFMVSIFFYSPFIFDNFIKNQIDHVGSVLLTVIILSTLTILLMVGQIAFSKEFMEDYSVIECIKITGLVLFSFHFFIAFIVIIKTYCSYKSNQCIENSNNFDAEIKRQKENKNEILRYINNIDDAHYAYLISKKKNLFNSKELLKGILHSYIKPKGFNSISEYEQSILLKKTERNDNSMIITS